MCINSYYNWCIRYTASSVHRELMRQCHCPQGETKDLNRILPLTVLNAIQVSKKNYEEERQAPKGVEWKNWEGKKLKQVEDN
jgi:hypothetical protein